MAQAPNIVTVTIKPDLAYGFVVDALQIATEALELAPEWNTAEREDLQNRIKVLSGLATKYIRVKH